VKSHLTCGQCRHFTGERYPNDGRSTIWKRCAAKDCGVMADTTAAEFCEHFLPPRIQLRRTKGWRKPEGAIVVSRPSRWGNPFVIRDTGGDWLAEDSRTRKCLAQGTRDCAIQSCLGEFERALVAGELRVTVDDVRRELRGKALACWCRLDAPCHADVLLEIANGTPCA